MAIYNDILEWSKSKTSWIQDALRRLITQVELSDTDIDEILLLLKKETGHPYIKFEAEPCPENGNYSLPEIGDGHIGDYAPGANSIDGWPLWESIGIFEFRVCAVSCPESDGSVFISGNGTCILLPVSCMPYYNITIGDANKDFSVDIGDIITILTHLYNKGQAARICIDAADMNGDGFVDILDVMLLMEEVFKSQ